MNRSEAAIGALADTMSDLISDLVPRKSFEEVVTEQNTTTKYFYRGYGLPRKYVYGVRPGEMVVQCKRHPEGRPWPSAIPESDPTVIGTHIAICVRERGSEGGLCDLCRKLDNKHRRAFLVRLYNDGRALDQAGFTVGEAVDKSDLKQPATSQYLRQLSSLGLVRRERHGRIVSYIPELSGATPCVREIGEMIRERWHADPEDESFVPIFRVMMGPFRARVVRLLASGECGSVEALSERFGRKPSTLIQHLEWAVKGGVLDLDSNDSSGVYRYVAPADPIARRIIELS